MSDFLAGLTPVSGIVPRRITSTMTRQELLDLYFMDARAKLIDIAAFMDRVERASGDADFRFDAFRDALKELERQATEEPPNNRAEAVLMAFSDPTTEPVEKAPGKGACGAWPGN